MKVAFVSQPFEDVIPPVEGNSLAIWTYQVARRLTSACDFIVYARRGHSQQKEQRHENIEYRRVPVTFEDQAIKPLKFLERLLGYPLPKRPLFSSPLYYPGYILQIARDLQQQRCDIIHIFNFSQFVPIIRAFNPGVKIVLHMQCEWLSQLDQAMIAQRLQQTDLVIGCSHYITERIQQRFPQFADRCQTVFNGVDFTHFVSNNGSTPNVKRNGVKKLLFVGRGSPEKGVHILLDAIPKIVEHYSQVELDIVGPLGNAPFEFMALISDDPKVAKLASFYKGRLRHGDYPAQLQKRLPAELASRVNFVGPISHSRIIHYYREADILINPSLTEAFGMSLVEAMASQIPVVASRIGGMPEIVKERETGLLVESGNAAMLAEAILCLLKDDNLRKSMGQAGRERVIERYSWDQVAASLLEQYNHLYPKHG